MSDASSSDAKVIVYWLEKSRSQRIVWLLEELNVPYELKRYKRGPDHLAGPEGQEIHPLGKFPMVGFKRPSGPPLVLAESGAIIEYIIDHFGGNHMVPKRYQDGKEGEVGGETEAWLRNRFFMHYTEGSLMTLLIIQLLVTKIRDWPLPFFIKPIPWIVARNIDSAFLQKNLRTHIDFLEKQAETIPDGGPYLCGPQLTGADFMMIFCVEAMAQYDLLSKEKNPALMGYLERVRERDAYKKAVAKIVELEGEYIPA